MSALETRRLETARGIGCQVFEGGGGTPLLFLHGLTGTGPADPLLAALATRHLVHAPVWPGYGDEGGEDALDDMLDFALHGWDIVDALGLARTTIVGHGQGGMVAAEMACLAPERVERLVLISAFGLWIDESPVPDLFAMLPFEVAETLFAHPTAGEAFLTGGARFDDPEGMQRFLVGNSRRLGTAGKILFPIPNRRLAKRLYRQRAPTLLVWGRDDRLHPPEYAHLWRHLLPDARIA